MSVHFQLERAGMVIKGQVYLPEKYNGKLPAIIMSHEFGTNMLSVSRYAKQIYSEGYAVFVFDFTCSGTGTSGGSSEDMSVLGWQEDLDCVLDYVMAQSYVDEKHITLMGCSQGGFVSVLTAMHREKDISSLVLYYPAFCIPDCAGQGSILGTDYDPDNVPETMNVMGLSIGRRYVDDAVSIGDWQSICTFRGPVLIVHGDGDNLVPIKYSQKASQTFRSCRLVVVKSDKHFFPSEAAGVAVEETKKFLKSINA